MTRKSVDGLVGILALSMLSSSAGATSRSLVCSAGYKFGTTPVTHTPIPLGFKVDITNPRRIAVHNLNKSTGATLIENTVKVPKGTRLSVTHSTGSSSPSSPVSITEHFTLDKDLDPGGTAEFPATAWKGGKCAARADW